MARRKWPKSIVLDGLEWTIEYVPEGHEMLKHESGDPDQHGMGASVEWTRTIYVCESLGEQTKRDTLVHEIIHSLYRTSSGLPNAEFAGDGEEGEEAVVKFATRAYWICRAALGRHD